MPKKTKVSDQLRRIVKTCGVSRYRIAQDTGVSESALSLFVVGKRGLSIEALDALGHYLDLRVEMHGPKQQRAR